MSKKANNKTDELHNEFFLFDKYSDFINDLCYEYIPDNNWLDIMQNNRNDDKCIK